MMKAIIKLTKELLEKGVIEIEEIENVVRLKTEGFSWDFPRDIFQTNKHLPSYLLAVFLLFLLFPRKYENSFSIQISSRISEAAQAFKSLFPGRSKVLRYLFLLERGSGM